MRRDETEIGKRRLSGGGDDARQPGLRIHTSTFDAEERAMLRFTG